MDLIEYRVRIVAPEGELSNERMDAALAATREVMDVTLDRFVETTIESRFALEGFTIRVEVVDG